MRAETRTRPTVRLRPGNGVLVRYDNLVLLCDMPPGAQDSVRNIVDVAKSAADADQPGRQLVRQLVKTLVASVDQFPSLCAFGAVDDGIAVAVHGKARLRVTTMDSELRLDGQDAVTIVDRVVAGQVVSITGEIGEEASGFCPWSELNSGIVRADGIQYGRLGDPEARADVETAAGELGAQAKSPAAAPEDGSRIVGVSCAKGHFNDPTSQYCAMCGIGLTQAGRRLVQQARPTLGVLVLDDGTSLPITKDCVIGRAPQTAPDVSNGDLTLVRLAGPGVSDVHARVRLEGWSVVLVDAGSANGTFLREPDTQQWTRVPSDGRTVLRPGAIVAVGGRQLRYDSYRRLR